MADSSQLHILIIGGGVAGLALAQLLFTNPHVRCSVFDRDASAASRHHKWSVSLSTCLAVIGPKLGPRLGPFTRASNVRDAGITDTGAILDWKTGDVRVKWGRENPGPGYFILANRQRIREYFGQRLDVNWGRKFSHYVEDAEGVTAFFEDGSSARGDLLVGVDGSGSRVRNQLLKDVTDIATIPQPYSVVAAEIPVTVEQHETLSSAADSFTMTMDNGSILHTALQQPLASKAEYDYSKDKGPAKYYYHLYMPDPEAAKLNPDHTDAEGKLYWTQTASPKELRERAVEFTKNWKGAVREIVELARDEDITVPPFLLRDWCPPEDLVLPRGRVTLMGDAAHQMIPFRGTGANNAILDAVELADLIGSITLPPGQGPKPGPPPQVQASEDPVQGAPQPGAKAAEQPKVPFSVPAQDILQKTLDDYWAKVLPRARETVLTSRQAMHKDPDGDITVQMITKAMSGGPPPAGMGGPGGPGGPGSPGGPPQGPPQGPPGGFDGNEADARRGLMWRG